MTGCVFGKDAVALQNKLAGYKQTAVELRQRGIAAGTANEIVDLLSEFAQAGAQRVMLQWIDLDDLDGLEALGTAVLPQI